MADVDYYSADDGIKGRDTRNGKYLDTVEQESFQKAMKAIEKNATEDPSSHRSPGNKYNTKEYQVRDYNNMRIAGDDQKDQTTFTATKAFTQTDPVVP